VRWVRCSGISFCEIKRLISPGCSLSSFGALCSAKMEKGIFCFEWLKTPESLLQTWLPPDAASWISRLTGTGPSQAEVDEACQIFAEKKCKNLLEYLIIYLKKDVIILARATETLMEAYFSIMEMDPIDAKKNSISSFSFAGSQMALFRTKRPGNFFCNDARTFSLLKNASRGGLCSVFRSFAGREADATPFVNLYKRQNPETAYSDEQIRNYLFKCNAHLFGTPEDTAGCEDGNWISYLDCNRCVGKTCATSGTIASFFQPLRSRGGTRARIISLLGPPFLLPRFAAAAKTAKGGVFVAASRQAAHFWGRGRAPPPKGGRLPTD
jgi:hypothetical protein